MIEAMYKKTEISCENLIQQAINKCSNPIIKQYILRNYVKNTHQ